MRKVSASESLRKATLYGLSIGGVTLALAGCSQQKKVQPSSAECFKVEQIVQEDPRASADYATMATSNDCARIKRTRLFAECPGGQNIESTLVNDFSVKLVCSEDGTNPRVYRMSDEWQNPNISSTDFANGMTKKYPSSTLVEVTTPNNMPANPRNGGFKFVYSGTEPVIMNSDPNLPILEVTSVKTTLEQ